MLASTSQLRWSSRDQGGRSVSCPGEVVNLTCTVDGPFHIWKIRSENVSINMVIEDLYPRSYSRYTFDGFVVNDNTMVTFLTFIATIGIINVTCDGVGDNHQSLTAEVIG